MLHEQPEINAKNISTLTTDSATNLTNASFFSSADHNIRWSDLTRSQSAACRRHRPPVPTWAGSRLVSRECWQHLERRRGAAWTTWWHRGRSVSDRNCRTMSGATADQAGLVLGPSPRHLYTQNHKVSRVITLKQNIKHPRWLPV